MGFPVSFTRHAAHQTVGQVHGDGAHHVIPQMLGNLENKIVFLVAEARVAHQQSREDGRELPFFELHVNDVTDNLYDPSDIHVARYLLRLSEPSTTS